MTDEEIRATVNAALAKEFELDESQLTPEASITEDLGLDSLDMVDMVIVLEKAFHFTLKDKNRLASIRTLGDIHAFIIAIQHEEQSSGQ